GVLLAWIASRTATEKARRYLPAISPVAVISFAALVASHITGYPSTRVYRVVFSPSLKAATGLFIVAAAYYGLNRPSEWIARPVELLRRISYSAYLWHTMFLFSARQIAPVTGP